MSSMMEREIFSQADVLHQAFESNKDNIKAVVSKIKEMNITQILIAARGSSNNAALYFKYLCEINTGIPVNFVYPSVITQYGSKLNMKGSLVLGISQSGKAPDVLTVLNEASGQGALTVSITNDSDSPLAKKADIHLYLNVGKEMALAATKTCTAQMLVMWMLVNELMGKEMTMPKVPQLINDVLAKKEEISNIADKYVNADELIILARGLNLSSANESTLKLQETCYINARAFALSDFHHGPFALVSNKSRIIVLAIKDRVFKDSLIMLEKIKPTGADVIVISEDEALVKQYGGLLLPSYNEDIMPFGCVVAGQLLSCILSQKKCIDPDNPRGLTKVTMTE